MARGRNGKWKETTLSIKVKKKLLYRNMTITDLAKEIEVSQSYLSQVLYGIKPGTDCIQAIYRVLDIKDKDKERRKAAGE